MPKKFGVILLALGAVLIILALSLLQYNRNEDAEVGQATENLLQDVQNVIAANQTQNKQPTSPTEPKATEEEVEPVLYVDGFEYIGCLSIPTLGLSFPVMAQWDYGRLNLAPCRHFGSIEENNLVIAAHNYRSHFGSLGKLELDAPISITDMSGEEHCYTVVTMKTMEATDVEEVQNSGYDLVLYTCTLSGKARLAVFCNQAEHINAYKK